MNSILRPVLQISIWLLSLLPVRVLTFLSKKILIITKYRKQVVKNNYLNTKIVKVYKYGFKIFYTRNINFISRLIVEVVKGAPSDIDDKFRFENINKLEEQCRSSKGLILLASHYGNWELACSLLPRHTGFPVYGVYKPLKNKVMDKLIVKKRSTHGLILTPMKKIGRTILENKRKEIPAIYILIADQNPNSKNSIIWSQFLGVNTAWFNGASKLCEKYKFNIAYMEVVVGELIYNYKVRFRTENFDPELKTELLDTYSDLLESQILVAPEYWLWTHKRWKRSF